MDSHPHLQPIMEPPQNLFLLGTFSRYTPVDCCLGCYQILAAITSEMSSLLFFFSFLKRISQLTITNRAQSPFISKKWQVESWSVKAICASRQKRDGFLALVPCFGPSYCAHQIYFPMACWSSPIFPLYNRSHTWTRSPSWNQQPLS